MFVVCVLRIHHGILFLLVLQGVVGKMLDRSTHAKDFMDVTFTQLAALRIDKDHLSSRVRFKIQDTIELRANKWVERRKVDTAKKLSEIKKEDAMEKAGRGNSLSGGTRIFTFAYSETHTCKRGASYPFMVK